MGDSDDVPSSRSFGVTLAVVFALIGAFPSVARGDAPHWWAVVVAAVLLFLGLANSPILRPFNLLWLRLGLVLHSIVNPLIMGLIYFCAVVPMGLLMRANLRRTLRLDTNADTYWIVRDQPAPKPGSMKKQF